MQLSHALRVTRIVGSQAASHPTAHAGTASELLREPAVVDLRLIDPSTWRCDGFGKSSLQRAMNENKRSRPILIFGSRQNLRGGVRDPI